MAWWIVGKIPYKSGSTKRDGKDEQFWDRESKFD
jgi:hypothetical protein